MGNSELHLYNIHQSYTVKHVLMEHSDEMTPCNDGTISTWGGGGGGLTYISSTGACHGKDRLT